MHKRKLKDNELVSMGKNVFALIQTMSQKCNDLGVFTIPCIIGDSMFEVDMLDLRSSINIMLRFVFQSLGIGLLQAIGVVHSTGY